VAAKKSSRKKTRPSKAEREFVAEAEEILERMREDLAILSDQRASGSEVDPDHVNSIFRSAHSLKGLAGLLSSTACAWGVSGSTARPSTCSTTRSNCSNC
jgi:HPt (histidine-containing phosphotransfer) domain-containing protein